MTPIQFFSAMRWPFLWSVFCFALLIYGAYVLGPPPVQPGTPAAVFGSMLIFGSLMGFGGFFVGCWIVLDGVLAADKIENVIEQKSGKA